MAHDTCIKLPPGPPGRHLALPLSAGLFFILLLLAGLIILPPLMHTHSEALRSHLTDDVLRLSSTLSATENEAQELRAALRGYVLTHDPGFLAQYREAERSLAAHLKLVTQLAPRVDPAMEAPAGQVVATFSRWQQEAGERQVALVQEGRAAVARQELVSGQSQELFAALRRDIQQMRGQTEQIGDELLAEINRWRIVQGLLTSGLAALGLLAAGFVISGHHRIVALMCELQVEREQTARLAAQAQSQLLEAEWRSRQATLPDGAEAAAPAQAPLAERCDAVDVLVVDEDPALRRLLERSLSEAGYRVETVAAPEAALEAVSHRPPDLIVLDLTLPGMDGFALCRQLREWTRVPIVILTVRSSEADIVNALKIGADDYVTRPFRMSELLARIEALLRRAQPHATAESPSCVTVGGLSVDLAQRQVTVEGREVSLTPTEYRLLAVLARHAGRVLTHEQIVQAVWGPEYRQENHYLWAHMTHLRQKIEADSRRPRYLLTERGVGYRLAGDGA